MSTFTKSGFETVILNLTSGRLPGQEADRLAYQLIATVSYAGGIHGGENRERCNALLLILLTCLCRRGRGTEIYGPTQFGAQIVDLSKGLLDGVMDGRELAAVGRSIFADDSKAFEEIFG
jgi:hypothetical protein